MSAYTMTCQQTRFQGVRFAARWHERLIGLLFTSREKFQGLAIKPCTSIHTIGMRYPIDVVFASNDDRVTCIHQNVKPFRVCFGGSDSHYVVELPAGSVDENTFVRGAKLDFHLSRESQKSGED